MFWKGIRIGDGKRLAEWEKEEIRRKLRAQLVTPPENRNWSYHSMQHDALARPFRYNVVHVGGAGGVSLSNLTNPGSGHTTYGEDARRFLRWYKWMGGVVESI